ncbi:AAA family ATPase [Ideonella dechloratans]|uniref:AAA family ATPase n=1 Tax=Ideonella dechloratans TaxID=36863 RepID=UPI0035AD81B9
MSAPLPKAKTARGPAKPTLPPRITAQSKAPSLLTAALNRYDVDVPGLDAMRHLTLMLLLAPKVPRHYENVARCLRQAYAGKLPQAQRAKRLLEAASEMLTDPERKAGQYIALMLYEEVLRFSDTPVDRLRIIQHALYLAGAEGGTQADPLPSRFPSRKLAPDGTKVLLESALEHARHVCEEALAEIAGGERGFGRWLTADFDATVFALRLVYSLEGGGLAAARKGAHDLPRDFGQIGEPLWRALIKACARRFPDFSRAAPKSGQTWRHQQLRLLGRMKATLQSGQLPPWSSLDDEAAQSGEGPDRLVICRNPIWPASERADKEEVERHKVLETALPLAQLPAAQVLRERQQALIREFPWAERAIGQMFSSLLGRARLGALSLRLPPTLLVGAPGSGKSRLALRFAERMEVPVLNLSLAGAHDAKILNGTSRGWGGGRPSTLATFLATRHSASALVILDELDKARAGSRNDSDAQSYLLGLLEPQTARAHLDCFLKVECDYSEVSWLATANRLSAIEAPLLSRLQVYLVEQPRPEHFPAICEGALGDLAKQWGVDRWTLPQVEELDIPWASLDSARDVRSVTEQAVMHWTERLQKH